MFLEFASWLHKTPISVALQVRSPWLWPTCEAIHFAGLALLLGVAGMFDLRLMGFMPRVPIRVIKGFMPWAMFGFTLNVLTGIIFVVSEPAQYFGNPTWWLKVAFLIVAGANALVFETRFGHDAVKLPPGILALDGKRVRITGFLVPILNAGGRIREFFIMSSQSSCCFGTAPRLFDFIDATMPEGTDIKDLGDPVVFEGVLHVRGLDCLDGTPLLDIKPYYATTDARPDAQVDRAGAEP